MLEATIVLQIAIGQWLTASMIAALLLFNVLLGTFQESKSNAALALLKQRLTLISRVKRDGVWIDAPAADLVPDDILQLSLGEVVPADVVIIDVSLLVDQVAVETAMPIRAWRRAGASLAPSPHMPTEGPWRWNASTSRNFCSGKIPA
jgi:magnesium-transporting ATPase (P-type)